MPPVDLEIQSDSEVESDHSSSEFSDSDSDSYQDQNDFEERQKKSGRAEVRAVAGAETRKLRRWKTLMIAMLLSTTAIVLAGTYYFLHREETDNFENTYRLLTDSIRDNVENHAKNLEQSLQGLSQIMSGSVPNWYLVAQATLAQSGVMVLAYSPLVETLTDIPSYFAATEGELNWYSESVNALVKSGQGKYADYDLEHFVTEIYNMGANNMPYPVNRTGPFAPLWLMHPPPLSSSTIHYNLLDTDMGQVNQVNHTRRPSFSRLLEVGDAPDFVGMIMTEEARTVYESERKPHSLYWVPVWMDPFDEGSRLAGLLTTYLVWDQYVDHLLPAEDVEGIICVISNSCGEAATYEIGGRGSRYRGPGDLHDTRYGHTRKTVPFGDTPEAIEKGASQCHYSFHFYASNTLEDEFHSNLPIIVTATVGAAFLVLILVFWKFDRFVMLRNRKVVSVAAKTNEIVASLFPEAVRNRLFDDKEETEKGKTTTKKTSTANEPRESLVQKFLSGAEMDEEVNEDDNFMYKSRPIADLYPDCTIMFADIAGFTAWSSTRDPAAVFTLLETFYKAFDAIASRRGVFKVETIGDCYVAVAGLPEPRDDHAVVMARFASECMERMNFLAQKLEIHLGPETAELEMRAGLHSGAVTAGVLRGVRSRFQLFGDTMNTASRMESTGVRGKIQVSEDTAELLVSAGKTSWLTPREERILAKGKGEMQTYFVNIASAIDLAAYQDGVSSIDGSLSYDEGPFASLSPKTTRLVLWNVEILLDLLRQVEAVRRGNSAKPATEYMDTVLLSKDSATTAYDEVQDAIHFPSFERQGTEIDTTDVELKPEVEEQLEDFLSTIASMYIDNHFHDFAHASHATMGVIKLLASLANGKSTQGDTTVSPAQLLASSPLAQFAVVLSVICHDVDHPGVPNSRLKEEKSRMASVYGFKSVAEQNSLDLTWDLLMDRSYDDLRRAIYQTDEEKKLFRDVLVNCVISTDLFDENLQQRFESRWKSAFTKQPASANDQVYIRNLQTTLVMETMVRASDIAHTIQHWQVYRKWNARLFEENYQAFVDGRRTTNPSEEWFQAELDFFDDFVLPIARRLQECGAFVAASTDSHIDYAEHNRTQWQERGRDLIAEMAEVANSKILARSQDYSL